MRSLLIVLPCFNEAGRLKVPEITAWAAAHPQCTMLFVDDGSTDQTLVVLSQMADRQANIQVLQLVRNVGKAEAVRQGVLEGDKAGQEFFAYWDSDLATPLDEVEPMLELFERHPETDLVLGSRIRLLGREIQRSPFRHFVGRGIATAISLIVGLPVYDSQCGAKVFRSNKTTRRLFAAPFLSRWLFDVEILTRYSALQPGPWRNRGAKNLVEHPLHRWDDVPDSKIGLKDTLRVLTDLFRIWARFRKAADIKPAD